LKRHFAEGVGPKKMPPVFAIRPGNFSFLWPSVRIHARPIAAYSCVYPTTNSIRSWPIWKKDVPVLDSLMRLGEAGEDPGDYERIWYYF
jgi:hypothetical protein